MPYNVVGEAQINAFLSSINQGLNLGTTSRIIGLYVKEPYFVGRAVRQNDSGQCSMTTIRGKLFNGETDAQVQSEFNAWRALSLTQQLDEVFGAILLN
jgi:hypothetical protein